MPFEPRLAGMADARPGTLVVGAGQAGLTLVTTLRSLGDHGPVTLVGDEAEPPYERPPLSKAYLRGEHDRASLVFRRPAWFAEHGIDLVTGDRVESVDRDEHGGVVTLASGRRMPFARLALTTGAENRRLDVPGADLDAVVSLRSLADADDLAARLATARDVVVVGGGFIGLEVAASARALGKTVTVVELTEHLLGRAVTPQLSRFYLAAHTSRGTRVALDSRIARIEGADGRVTGVVLGDGERLAAGLVVVGVGALPRTGLATDMGLETEPRGILVDAAARTSDGLTVAAGDCALGPNPFSRGLPGATRLESVAHADDQAVVAAATLLGRPAAYGSVPWFWSDQADLKLQIAGLPAGADHTVTRGDPSTESFSLLSFRDGLLVAAECVGSSADYLAAKRGLEKGLTVDPVAATDAAVPLKRLLRPTDATPAP